LHKRIKQAVDAGNVALVILQYMKWKSNDGAGSLRQKLHYAYIGATAHSRHLAFTIHRNRQSQPLLRQDTPPGWIYGDQVYLWFEDEEKQKEHNKAHRANLFWELAR
jgi:hypothetical protein